MGRIIVFFVFLGAVFGNPTPQSNPLKTTDVETLESSDVLENKIEQFIKNQQVTFDVPIIGSKLILEGKNLDNDEIAIKLNFNSGSEVQARKKKSKLKKMFVPILVFIVIKAMTLIPLALGILGIKAWNATQLSFISFVSSLAMAIWKLCSKVSHEPPQIIHQTFDPHLHHFHDRKDSISTSAGGNAAAQMAYAGYTQ